jgi:hypothetical protein
MFSSNAGVFPESKTAEFTDQVISLAQTLNSALSSFLIQTMGLEARENLPAPQIVALQKNPQDRIEASEAGFIPPLSEKKELEDVGSLEKAPESDSNNIPEAAVLSPAVATESHDQSSDLVVDTKDSSEVQGQQGLVALTPSVAPLQDLHQVKEQTIRLQSGATILGLVREVYGAQNTLALALIKEFNPRINDLDYVTAGTTIFAPSLTEETLLRKQPDGSYRLLIAVFLRATLAQKHADLARQHGYSVEVFPAQVAGSLLLYRVEIVGLPNREAGQHAWTFVDVHNVLTVASQPSENGKRTE